MLHSEYKNKNLPWKENYIILLNVVFPFDHDLYQSYVQLCDIYFI